MRQEFRKVEERAGVDLRAFRDQIVPRNQPVVMRGLVRSWPAVQAGLESDATLATYIGALDKGRPVETLVGPSAIKGRFFYRDDLKGLNFERRQEPISASLNVLLSQQNGSGARFVQSASVPENLPGFTEANVLALVGTSAIPRIWIGNAITVATHYDLSYNIACVVGGRRRFTFFPPEQIRNLYVGPLHLTLAGQPVSMVALDEPDLARYPRFAEALSAAQQVELGPGDAVYIPYFWWHHVQSLTPFNVLVNYWWNEWEQAATSPYDCLLHGLLTLRNLPEDQRAAWRAVFDHYVFQTGGDPVAHLPIESRGALGPMTPEQASQIRAGLLRRLNRPT